MDWMLRRIKGAIWSDKHVVAKGDFGIIHKEAVTVGEKMVYATHGHNFKYE